MGDAVEQDELHPQSMSCPSTEGKSDQNTIQTPPSQCRERDEGKDNPSRHVTFSTIQFRWYEQTLGDQPCFHGPPLDLGWQYDQSPTVSLDDYEMVLRNPDNELQRRRTFVELKMPAAARVARLQAWGYSQTQIQSASRTARQALLDRMHTARETDWQQESRLAWETMFRRLKFQYFSDKSKRETIVWQIRHPRNKTHNKDPTGIQSGRSYDDSVVTERTLDESSSTIATTNSEPACCPADDVGFHQERLLI